MAESHASAGDPGRPWSRERPEAVGSVEEEAHKLVRAASTWWQQREQSAGGAPAAEDTGTGPAVEDASAEQDHDRATCTGCPWCRARSGAGPLGTEAMEGLADLLGAAADSLRAVADSRRATSHPPADDGQAEDRPEGSA